MASQARSPSGAASGAAPQGKQDAAQSNGTQGDATATGSSGSKSDKSLKPYKRGRMDSEVKIAQSNTFEAVTSLLNQLTSLNPNLLNINDIYESLKRMREVLLAIQKEEAAFELLINEVHRLYRGVDFEKRATQIFLTLSTLNARVEACRSDLTKLSRNPPKQVQQKAGMFACCSGPQQAASHTGEVRMLDSHTDTFQASHRVITSLLERFQRQQSFSDLNQPTTGTSSDSKGLPKLDEDTENQQDEEYDQQVQTGSWNAKNYTRNVEQLGIRFKASEEKKATQLDKKNEKPASDRSPGKSSPPKAAASESAEQLLNKNGDAARNTGDEPPQLPPFLLEDDKDTISTTSDHTDNTLNTVNTEVTEKDREERRAANALSFSQRFARRPSMTRHTIAEFKGDADMDDPASLLEVDDNASLLDGDGGPVDNLVCVPPRTSDFVGRRELLRSVDVILAEQHRLVVTGEQGIGKTTAAVEYVYRYRHFYSMVWWVNAKTTALLLNAYRGMAAELGLADDLERSWQNPSWNALNILERVQLWLQRNEGWLIVFDGALSLEHIRDFIPSSGGCVLVTSSRRTEWVGLRKLELSALTDDESVKLIMKATHDPALPVLQRLLGAPTDELTPVSPDTPEEQSKAKRTQAEVLELCHELHNFPMALRLAGTYLFRSGVRVTEYLELLRMKLGQADELPPEVSAMPRKSSVNSVASQESATDSQLPQSQSDADLKRDVERAKHLKSVQAAANFSIVHLSAHDAWALEVMRIAAFLSPFELPMALLERWVSAHHTEDFRPTLQLHEKVETPTGKAAPHSESKIDASAAGSANNHGTEQKDSPAVIVQAAVTLLKRYGLMQYQPARKLGVDVTHDSDEHGGAARMGSAVITFHSHRTVSTHLLLQKAVRKSMKAEVRRRYAQELVDLLFRTVNQDGASVAGTIQSNPLDAAASVAKSFASGHVTKIRDVAAVNDAVADSGPLPGLAGSSGPLQLGPAALSTQWLIHHCQCALQNAFSLPDTWLESSVMPVKVLSASVRRWAGALDAAELACRIGLYYSNFDIITAEAVGAMALPAAIVKACVTGDDDHEHHVLQAHYLRHYARCLSQATLGRYSIEQYAELAMEALESALTMDQKAAGSRSAMVAKDLYLLASLTQNLGQLDQALEFADRAVAIDEELFGDAHLAVARDLYLLGTIYDSMKKPKLASKQLIRALKIHRVRLGEDHPDVIKDLLSLSSVYVALGDDPTAIKYAEQALSRQKKVHLARGIQHHPATARILNSIGSSYNQIGDSEKAVECFTQALEITRNVQGDEHPDTATSLSNLAWCYDSMGDVQSAVDFYEKALEIDLKVFGPTHPTVATSYNNLAYCLNSAGRFSEAVELYRKALSIKQDTLGIEDGEVAAVMNNLGTACFQLKHYEEAAKYLQQAYTISKKVFGEKHQSTVVYRTNWERAKGMLTPSSRAASGGSQNGSVRGKKSPAASGRSSPRRKKSTSSTPSNSGKSTSKSKEKDSKDKEKEKEKPQDKDKKKAGSQSNRWKG